MADQLAQTDLVLAPGVYAYIQDNTKGELKVHVGPTKQALSPQQDSPVVMDATGRFRPKPLDEAIKTNVVAYQGQYIVLKNPAKDLKQPRLGGSSTPDADGLRIGDVVNIPGPISFPLWPMQIAEVVLGHDLKSNQYLLVRVYDEKAARENWGRGVVKEVGHQQSSTDSEPPTTTSSSTAPKLSAIDPNTLVIGQQLIIRGTEVSFYIPPTGVEVLKEGSAFVRDALTLERLEYCLLVDENGNKRYVRGEEVVFPKPTESFKLNDDGHRKSQAYELNEITGIHIKVIAKYEDAFKVVHNEGEELFITGNRKAPNGSEEETSIYFPRIEHAILKYGGTTRYHAVAIPAGEARYVLDRLSGAVRLEHGPSMFLPDPRKEVIARRALSELEATTYFPGNEVVRQFNEGLRKQDNSANVAAILSSTPAYRTGHVIAASLGDYMDSASLKASRAGDVIQRGTTHTPPRSILLDGDAKFEGAVRIRPWTGYAVKIVNQKGDQRVEIGPKTIQLEFDERLDILSFSTKTPKVDVNPLKTVYLKINHNTVSDIVQVRTRDLVDVQLKLKYSVKFDLAKKDLWFNVDNYIQILVDRLRSLISKAVGSEDIAEFFPTAADSVRALILKDEKPFLFEENGMSVYELDVLGVQIVTASIAQAMQQLQMDRITYALDGVRVEATRKLSAIKESERRENLNLEHDTAVLRLNNASSEADIAAAAAAKAQEVSLQLRSDRAQSDKETADLETETSEFRAQSQRLLAAPAQESAKITNDLEIATVKAESDADVARIREVNPQLVQALVAMATAITLRSASEGFGDLAVIRQQSLGGILDAMFKGTPIEGLLDNLKGLGTGAVAGK